MDISPASIAAIRTTYSQIYQEAFLQQEVYWPKVAQLVTSKGETETHVWLDRIPQLRPWKGDRILQNAALRSYVLANVPYELTVALDLFKVKDNQLGSFEPVVREIAEQTKKWPDVLLFDATKGTIPNGQSFLTYDGQNFYSTTHPTNPDLPSSASNPSQSNYSASGLALTSPNFGTVRQTMRGYKGADGLPLKVLPKLLLLPPALEATGIQILKDNWIAPAGAFYSGAANVLQPNPFYGLADCLVVDDLAGQDTRWYELDNGKSIKPYLFQLRDPAEFVMKDKPNDPAIFSRHEIQYGSSVRGATGYGPWFFAYSAAA